MSFRFDDAKFPEGRFLIFPATVRSMCLKLEEKIILVQAEFDLDELIAKRFAGVENLQIYLYCHSGSRFPKQSLEIK